MKKILPFAVSTLILLFSFLLSGSFDVNQNQNDSHVELSSKKSSEDLLSPQEFLSQNCFKCHDEDVQKGDLRLDTLKWAFNSREAFEIWGKVFKAVEEGQMPPKKKPSAEVLNQFLNTLHEELSTAENRARSITGRSVVRRLTRTEYENTVRDIFDLPYIDMARYLPEDGNLHGFNKNHHSLDFSAVHLKNYMDAAGTLLEHATYPGPKPAVKTFNGKIVNTGSKEHYFPVVEKKDGELWLFTNGFATHHVKPAALSQVIEHSGFYEIEFKAKAVQTKKAYLLKLFSDANTAFQSEWQHINFYDVEADKWTSYKERVFLEKDSKICFTTPESKHRRSGARILTQPAVSLKDIKVRGPFYDEWPLKRHAILWDDIEFSRTGRGKKISYKIQKPENEIEKARFLIGRFIKETLRSPASNAEVQLFFNIFQSRFKDTNDFESSMLSAYKAILCSPVFLFKQESIGGLKQYELASRLSYFLWNSGPDEQLMLLAGQNKLHGKVLSAQVERLLNDEKSMRFINDFNEQWLNLSDLFATDPDPRLYPEASPALFSLMKSETNLFVKELIQKDLSVLNIVDSNFAMLNGRLASHYGIKGVSGANIRAVRLPEGHERGGIISQGSILKVTANGTVTSPITRGVWFLERIMGTPPPLPPNAVPAFEPEASGVSNLKEGLAKHRTNAACNNCHKRIDPPGFAFECFDPIGGYREKYRIYDKNKYTFGSKVEKRDFLPDGAAFNSIQEFKALILRDKKTILKNMLNKLSIYSTGQELGFSDKEEIEQILKSLELKNYGFRSMIHELVQSKIFSSK